MLDGLGYVKETISLREQDIKENAFETNKLLIEDILMALGYNRRRDRGVKETYSGGADWEISSDGQKRFMLGVCGYGTEEDADKLKDLIKSANENEFPLSIITDGVWLAVYDSSISSLIFKVNDIYSDDSDDLLNVLEKNNFNLENIYSKSPRVEIDKDKLLEILLNIQVLPLIGEGLGIDNQAQVKKALSDLINSSNNTTQTENITEAEDLNKRVAELESTISSKDTEITNLNTQLASVNQELETAKAVQDEVKTKSLEDNNKISELTATIDSLNSDISDKDTEISNLNQKINELNTLKDQSTLDSSEIEKYKSQIEGYKSQVEEYKTKVDTKDTQISELTTQISTKDTQIQELNTKIVELETKINTNGSAANGEITESHAQALKQIEQLQAFADQLREENDKLKADKTDFSKDNKFETESAYRERIAELVTENQKQLAELTSIKEKLDDMERKAAGAEDEKVTMAKQLLEAVEDNEDLRRTYVGVVESKLFQVMELNKFVGICLQELFGVVEYDLMPILFDGDMFRIIQPAVRKDLMISTNSYDLDLSDLSELEVIGKLKKIFNSFPKVVFMCKTIGTLPENAEVGLGAATVEHIEQPEEVISTFDNEGFDSIPLDDNVQSDGFDVGGYSDLEAQGFDTPEEFSMQEPTLVNTDDIQNMQNMQNMQFDNVQMEELNQQYEQQPEIKLLGFTLTDISKVLPELSDTIINLEAMGNPQYCFRIRNETFYYILNEGIIAMLAMMPKASDIIQSIKHTNLQEISPLISPDSSDENSIRILNTNFFAMVNSVPDCISIILSIANMIGINQDETYIYFSSEYNEQSQFVNNYIDLNQINLDRYINYDEITECKDTIHCLITGQNLDLIDEIPGVYEICSNLVTQVMAVRTPYRLNKTIKNWADMAETLKNILEASVANSPEEIIKELMETIPSEVPIFVTDKDDAQAGAEIMEVNGTTYYLNPLPGYESALILFRANKSGQSNDDIDLRLCLNSTQYMVYKNGVDISDCEEYLASKVFLEMIDGGRTKVIVNKK